MLDAVSSLEQSMANMQQQASLIALRAAADSQRQIADILMRQVEPSPASSNPAGVGQNVDTFA